jgi:hypothetical protein
LIPLRLIAEGVGVAIDLLAITIQRVLAMARVQEVSAHRIHRQNIHHNVVSMIEEMAAGIEANEAEI